MPKVDAAKIEAIRDELVALDGRITDSHADRVALDKRIDQMQHDYRTLRRRLMQDVLGDQFRDGAS